MTTRTIGELVAPIIAKAIGMARLQEFLDQFESEDRAYWVKAWREDGTIDRDEFFLLIDHNRRCCK